MGVSALAWGKGVSHYTYDINGHLLGAIDEVGKQSFTYLSNAQGQVMLREQRDAGTLKQTHRYYYAEGKAVGDVGNDGDTNVDYAAQLANPADTSSTGNTYTDRQTAYKNWRPVSSADFDQNYQAITASYPGTAPGSVVVQAGDSLYSIAASQWGDASLWYLIAEANGLSGASSLTPGQTLSIPNKVTNVHNSSSTSGVYDAGKTMGDTSPTIPDAPPPPRQDDGCGALGTILIVVVAIAVTVYTAGAAAGLMGASVTTASGATVAASSIGAWSAGIGVLSGAGGLGAAALGAAAIGGAVGSIASQGVAMAMGMQSEFSWKGVAAGAIGAGASAGIGAAASAYGGVASSMEWSSVALRAAGSSVVTQGVSSVLGVGSFSWKGVAAAAAGAGASSALGSAGWMNGMNSIAAGTIKGLVSGGVQAGIFETKPNWGSIAAQSFGQAAGDSTVEQIQQADLERSVPEVVSADEKAAILGMFEGGPDVEPAGNGMRVGGPSNAGLRLTADAAARWSDRVDVGIKDKALALGNFDATSERVWAREDAAAVARAQADLPRQHARADAYGRELAEAAQRARWDAMQVGAWSGRTGTSGPVWHASASAGAAPVTSTYAGDITAGAPYDEFGLFSMPGSQPIWNTVVNPVAGSVGSIGPAMQEFKYGALESIRIDTELAAQRRDTSALYGNALKGAVIEKMLPGSPQEVALGLGAGVVVGKVVGVVSGALVNKFPVLGTSIGGAESATVLQVRTAAEANQTMVQGGNLAAWGGATVTTEVVPVGTRFNMVISEGQAQALMVGKPAFGGWATPDAIPSQAFARNNLAILPEFKPDVSFVARVETTAPQTVNRGLVGPLGDYSGGANQVEFFGGRSLKLVGQPQPLPLGR